MSSPTDRKDQSQLSSLNRRELYLWVICGVIVTITCLGLITAVLPDVLRTTSNPFTNGLNLPQLMVGFICLLVLFGIHVVGQRRDLIRARDALYRRLIMEEARAEGILDPLTQTYSPLLIESILERLTKEATPESPLALFEVMVCNSNSIQRRNGDAAVAHLGRALGEILRNSLRGSDRICRDGEGNFLIMLPNTSAELAEIPARRIRQGVDKWNDVTSGLDYKLEINLYQASSVGDTEPAALLEMVRRPRKEATGPLNIAVLRQMRRRSSDRLELHPSVQIASPLNAPAIGTHASR